MEQFRSADGAQLFRAVAKAQAPEANARPQFESAAADMSLRNPRLVRPEMPRSEENRAQFGLRRGER